MKEKDRIARKEKLGCTAPSKRPHVRGPKVGAIKFNRCPVRFVPPDVIAFFSLFDSAAGVLSVSERLRVSPPFASAWDYLKLHKGIQNSQMKLEAAEAVKGG